MGPLRYHEDVTGGANYDEEHEYNDDQSKQQMKNQGNDSIHD